MRRKRIGLRGGKEVTAFFCIALLAGTAGINAQTTNIGAAESIYNRTQLSQIPTETPAFYGDTGTCYQGVNFLKPLYDIDPLPEYDTVLGVYKNRSLDIDAPLITLKYLDVNNVPRMRFINTSFEGIDLYDNGDPSAADPLNILSNTTGYSGKPMISIRPIISQNYWLPGGLKQWSIPQSQTHWDLYYHSAPRNNPTHD